MSFYNTPQFAMGVFVIVDHKNDEIAFAAKCSEHNVNGWCNLYNKKKVSYQQCALKAVAKMIADKTVIEKAKPKASPLDVYLLTNSPNVAKAVTRAFILARDQFFNNVNPITELKRRGKDLDLYIPLINAIIALYAVVGGIKQVGFVGTKANYHDLYRDVRDQVKSLGVDVKKSSSEGCTALNDGFSNGWSQPFKAVQTV